MSRGSRDWDPAILSKLGDSDFCFSRGLSEVQAKLIQLLFDPSAPENVDQNNAYAHVIAGYLRDIPEEREDFSGEDGGTTFLESLKLVIPVVFDDQNAAEVKQYLEEHRLAVLKKYSKRDG